jgi:hypothetical protein
MLQSEFDNITKWNGKEKPFYEVYYLKVNEPSLGGALWLRYTFLSPLQGSPSASLWAIFFDSKDHLKNIAMKETVSTQDIIFKKKKFELNIGGAHLNNTSSSGMIVNDKNSIGWDLSWKPSDKTFKHYPWPLYLLPWPKSKVAAPNLNVPVNGYFEVNGLKFNLFNASLHQGHVWGRSYSGRWAWANCGSFLEDKNATLELIMKPPIGLGYLKTSNEEFKFRFRNLYQPLSWEFMGKHGSTRLIGKIETNPEDIIGVTYDDPISGERYCYNTKVASCLLKIGDRNLTSVNTTAFETVESVINPHLNLSL